MGAHITVIELVMPSPNACTDGAVWLMVKVLGKGEVNLLSTLCKPVQRANKISINTIFFAGDVV